MTENNNNLYTCADCGRQIKKKYNFDRHVKICKNKNTIDNNLDNIDNNIISIKKPKKLNIDDIQLDNNLDNIDKDVNTELNLNIDEHQNNFVTVNDVNTNLNIDDNLLDLNIIKDKKQSKTTKFFSKADLEPYVDKNYTERDIVNLKCKIGLYYQKFPELNNLLPKLDVNKIKDGPTLEYYLQKIKNTLNYNSVSSIVEDNIFNLMGAIEAIVNQFNFIDIHGWTENTKLRHGDAIQKALSEMSIDYFDMYQNVGNPVSRLLILLSMSMFETYKANKLNKKINSVSDNVFNKYKDLINK